MAPNIYAVILLCELEHQERQHNAAKGRLVTSAERSTPSPLAWLGMASPIAAGRRAVRRLLATRMRQPARIPPLAIDPGPGGRSTVS
jgi:hypothetical protein